MTQFYELERLVRDNTPIEVQHEIDEKGFKIQDIPSYILMCAVIKDEVEMFKVFIGLGLTLEYLDHAVLNTVAIVGAVNILKVMVERLGLTSEHITGQSKLGQKVLESKTYEHCYEHDQGYLEYTLMYIRYMYTIQNEDEDEDEDEDLIDMELDLFGDIWGCIYHYPRTNPKFQKELVEMGLLSAEMIETHRCHPDCPIFV